MSEYCVTKVEASKLLGISVRMVEKYLHRGDISVDHKEGRKAMIPIEQVYNLREQKEKRKRGILA